MKLVASLALAMSLAASSAFAAGDHGTAQEAQALVQKAVALIKANGAEKAYPAFSTNDFRDRDLYIFVQTLKGVTVAHGTNPKLVGKDMSETVDTDGKLYVKERLELAKSQKSFWTDYKYGNPVTKKIEPKSTYCEVLDEVLICSGIYK